MKFYDPVTWHSLRKKIDDKELKALGLEDPRKFYATEIVKSLRSDPNEWCGMLSASNLMSERTWYQLGKPYYKVWPGVFDPFIATRLDISTDYLRAPHKAFFILFPELDEPLLSFRMSSGEWHVTTILVEDFSPSEVIQQVKDGLVASLDTAFPKSQHKDKSRGIIKIRIDFKSKEGLEKYMSLVKDPNKDYLKDVHIPSVFFRNIEVVPGITIEQSIGEFVDIQAEGMGEFNIDPAKEVVPASIIEACFRLVVGIYFVSTGSQKVLEYDVLSKHLSAYQEMREQGDEEKCREYEKKAKLKGKFGWHVGIDRKGRNLVLPKGVTFEDAVRQAGGHHRLYRHERGAHWHLYWTGEGRKSSVVKWVEETVVRPDLPVKPIV